MLYIYISTHTYIYIHIININLGPWSAGESSPRTLSEDEAHPVVATTVPGTQAWSQVVGDGVYEAKIRGMYIYIIYIHMYLVFILVECL